MADPSSPKTPTARKSLPGSPSARIPSARTPSARTPQATTLGSPISVQKRKWQGDNLALPLQGLTRSDSTSENAPIARMVPVKRPKAGDENKTPQHHNIAIPASSAYDQRPNSFLTDSPSRSMNIQQGNQQLVPIDWRQKVFLAALKAGKPLLPANPLINPVTSRRIDNITHAMWQVVFANELMMQNVTKYSAMFSQLKLRALAKLNYLPSWWYLRDMACDIMKQQGWNVDDSEMQGVWLETVEWCVNLCAKWDVQNNGSSLAKQGKGAEVQEGVSKME